MRAKIIFLSRQPAIAYRFGVQVAPIAALFVLLFSQQAHADPLLLQTGAALHSEWLTVLFGLAVEAAILAVIIRRALREVLTASILASLVTAFAGFVALLYFRLHGVPALPVGPAALMAAVIQAVLISVMLSRPPVKRIIVGVVATNLLSAGLALAVLAPKAIQPASPGASEDIQLSQAMSTVKDAIDEFHSKYNYFPPWLSGGSAESAPANELTADPLLKSGILECYPSNPYAPYLRSKRFNLLFLLTGYGPPTRTVSLDEPSDDWEVKWFPVMKNDPRFSDPKKGLLSVNGLFERPRRNLLAERNDIMHGIDYVPGCFFYKAFDFDNNGLADDYVLGIYGWPGGMAATAVDLIDGRTGEISLCLDSKGCITAGDPDGEPETVLAIYVAGTPPPEI
jgi:hypothetical protein